MQKKLGFTLAEVLITLGIIGVVAAMTIPTLMTNTQASQYKAAFKKAYAQLANAVKLNAVQNGYDFSNIVATPEGDIDTSRNKTMGNLIAKNFEGPQDVTNTYFTDNVAGTTLTVSGSYNATFTCPAFTYKQCTKTALQGYATLAECQAAAKAPSGKQCTKANDKISYTATSKDYTAATAAAFQLADGSIFVFERAGAGCTEGAPCYGFIDVNGPKGPNQATEGADSIQDIVPIMLMGQRLGLTDNLKPLLTD